jgi:hypothetical protein
MQARFPLMRMVVGCASIPGQHVDKANSVRWICAFAYRFHPVQRVLIGA